MPEQQSHNYQVRVEWTGNLGRGTSTYRDYSRSHRISAGPAPPIAGSADPSFLGDETRYNPEQLLLASLSACHMLWYLHLCADAGIVVVEYADEANGTMTIDADGTGEFSEAILRPRVLIARNSDLRVAAEVNRTALRLCFIARSVNFPIRCEPVVEFDSGVTNTL